MAHYSPEDSFESLKQRTAQTIQAYFPIEGGQHTLTAKRVWVDDNKSIDDIREQRDAKIKGRSWTVPIKAELELRDKKTNKVIDKQIVNVAQLPKITRRYSYIVGGNEVQINNLFRMKSGVYTRIRRNGELTSQWNLAKGQGFHMDFSPKTQKMALRYGESQIPLYPILKTMGVDDDTIERAWGKDILSANKSVNSDNALRKFYRAVHGSNPETVDLAKSSVLDEFSKTVLLPESTKLTLGKPYDTVNGPSLLAGSNKILQVSRLESEPDDRDSLPFKELHSAEDLINERLERWKVEKGIKRKIGNTLDKHDRVRDVINPDIFGKPLRQLFVNSVLSERPTQPNPMGFISGNRKTTLFAPGEGGIASSHEVSLEVQSINPSHLGFLDPVQTPECFDEKTEVYTSKGWKFWKDVTPSDLLACRPRGKVSFRLPHKLIKEHYAGTMYGLRSKRVDYLVTPSHRIYYALPNKPEEWLVDSADRVHGKEVLFDKLQAVPNSVSKPSATCSKEEYYTVHYDGMIYCATIPGGLLFVRRSSCSGFWSGNSDRIGVTLQLASHVVKDGHDLKIPVFNLRTGKRELINSYQALKSNLAFPDQYEWKDGKPSPRKASIKVSDPDGSVTVVKPKDVDYALVSSKGMFDLSANMIPFLQNNQGNRTMVASRQIEQAVSLKHREAPLVQTRSEKANRTFEQGIGEFVSHVSPVSGKVVSVKKDAIVIKGKDGVKHEVQLYDDYPLNEDKSVLNSTPLVGVGDDVSRGQVVSDTNFTRDGTLSLGTNLRVAYMPWKGLNFEDGVVISESAAKKLTSEHLYRERVTSEKNIQLDKKKFLSYMAGKVTKEQADKLDDTAVVREGQIVNKDDILVGVLKEETVTPDEQKLGLFSKGLIRPWKPREIRWTKDVPGVVTRVSKYGKDTTVYVRADVPADVGDKIAGRHGNKGVLTRVLPDHEMPHNKDGTPVEVLLNLTGVPTRINLGQVLETAAAKIAEKNGKPYVVNNFDPDIPDYTRHLQEELKKNGVSDTEDLYDPVTNRKFPNVLTGPQYILKLHHTADKKLSVRSRDAYDSNMLPSGGGFKGGQTMDAMGLYALLAHNARENIREMQTLKSDFNDDFWTQLQAGDSIPTPQIPFVFKKFEGYLKGMGLDIRKDGNNMILQPLTDKKVLELSNGALTDAGRALWAKDAKEEVGGIFDPKITGGVRGKKFSHIPLPDRMPNPIFEGSISALLGLNQNSFSRVVNGEEDLNGKTGPTAIVAAIKAIDPGKMRKDVEGSLPALRASKLNDANKKIKYLRALDRAGMSPTEAYTMKHLSVLPPVFRPITIMDNGVIRYDDVNRLYNHIGHVNLKLKDIDPAMPPEEKVALQTALYDGVKAVMLTGGMHQGKHRNAIMQTISGSAAEGGQPKKGFFQNKIIGRRQDLSMRSVIVPEPALSLDEVGLPRKAAAELYKPFVVRRLVQMGQKALDAQDMVRKNHPAALEALQAVVEERPVIMKRDPVLHKFSVQAFWPRLVEGKAVQIHPLATGGFNADFDGDTMSIIGDIIVIDTRLESCYDSNMHTGKLIAHRVIDIKDFPRIEESAKKDSSGSIEYDVPVGVHVPAFREGRFETMPVSKFHVHPGCEEWIVQTKNGRVENCAADHSLVILDPGTLETRKATPAEALGHCLPVIRSLASDRLRVLPGSVLQQTKGAPKEMVSSAALREEEGWFVGATVGDGWITQPSPEMECQGRSGHLSHGKGGEEVQHKWKLLAVKLSKGAGCEEGNTPHQFDGHDCESVKTTISSTALGLWLEPLIGKGAFFKHLPERFLDTPLKFRCGLFCGLIDTDGTVNWGAAGQFALNYNTSSRRLAEEMLLLGLSLGLPSNITTTTSPTGSAHYVVHFSIRPVQDASWVRLTHPNKADALKKLQGGEQIEFGRNDFVPMPELARLALLEHLRELGATRKHKRNAAAFSLYVVLRRQDPTITRESVKKLAAFLHGRELGDYLSKWFELAQNESVGWDLVISSEATGKRIEMYDLTVPDAWTFTMADGAVVWDSVFVPISQKAVKEAIRMLPSFNLFSPTTGYLMSKPTQESMMGLYKLTEVEKKEPIKFSSAAEAARAVKEGKILLTDPISLGSLDGDAFNDLLKKAARPIQTTVGRVMLYQSLPEELRDRKILSDSSFLLNEKNLNDLLTSVATKSPKDFGTVADRLKDIGNEYSTGMSIGLDDFVSDYVHRDEVMLDASKKEAQIRARVSSPVKKKEEIIKLYIGASEKIHDAAKKKADHGKNRMYDWIKSGARSNWSQFKQMTVAPMLVADSRGDPVPIPIPKSYSEGLDIGSYFASMHGARMGTIGKVQGTQAPGTISKLLTNTAMNQLVVDEDCGTTKGIVLPIDNRDVLDRFIAKDIDLGTKGGVAKGKIPAGTLVTPDLLSRLKNNKISKLEVRSPLRCVHGIGLCSRCCGLNEEGNLHAPGTNVGVIASQALGEPATQLSMNCNAAGNLVTVRRDGKQAILTFEQLWEGTLSHVDADEGIETKIPLNLEVWDHCRFTPVYVIQRHKPSSPMVLIRTKTGHSFITQDTHPNWARRLVPACPSCGGEEPVEFVGNYKSKAKTRVRCAVCHHPYTVLKNTYENQQEFVAQSRDLKSLRVGVSSSPKAGRVACDLPLPPYLLGMALAEGSVRRVRSAATLPPERKHRNRAPYGAHWKILGFTFNQTNGAVKDEISRCLKRAAVEYTTPSPETIQVNDADLARRMWSLCGIGSSRKRLPPGWESAPVGWIEALLAGLIDGDGVVEGVKGLPVKLYTTSWSLASQVMAIVRLVGGYATAYATTNRKLTKNQCYTVSIKLRHELPTVKPFKVVPFDAIETTYPEVIQVRKVVYEDWTYDLATESRSFTANGVRTHNSFHCNHSKSIVFCKLEGSAAVAMTLEQLFDSVRPSSRLVDKEEARKVTGWKVLDRNHEWTEITQVRRHAPTRPMSFVAAGGLATVCQDNHPLAVKRNLIGCVSCGYHSLKKSSYPTSQPYCPKCNKSQPFPKQDIGMEEFLPPAKIPVKRYFMSRDVVTPSAKGKDLQLDPYVTGMYLSEGGLSFRRSNWGSKSNPEKKPYTVSISQNPGKIKSKLISRYARNIALPPQFIQYSDKWLADCLAGVIDGDGTIKRGIDGPDLVRIDTTSFALAQQIAIIAFRLGIRPNIGATAQRKLTRHQGFSVSLRVTKAAKRLLKSSIKVQKMHRLSPDQDVTCVGEHLVTVNKEVLYAEPYVYDVTTKSGTLVVSGLLSHNSGGIVGARGTNATSLFNRLEQLLNVPDKLPGSATLSDTDGVVSRVEKDSAGGWRVSVDPLKASGMGAPISHYVPAARSLSVKKGDNVRSGDPLSDGPKNPREVLARTNMNTVQQYLTDELWNSYKEGGPVRRRNVETFVRAMTNLCEVVDSGDHDTLLKGDHTATSEIIAFNRGLKPGQRQVTYKPILQGVNILPLELQTDWIARLQSRGLKSTILDAAAEGWSSSLHSAHPIPGMAVGKFFGLGTEKEPWLY